MLNGPVRTRRYPGKPLPTGTCVAGSTAQPGAGSGAVIAMYATAAEPTTSTAIAMCAASGRRRAVAAMIAIPPAVAMTKAMVPAVPAPG